jgi:hypothetical protein
VTICIRKRKNHLSAFLSYHDSTMMKEIARFFFFADEDLVEKEKIFSR